MLTRDLGVPETEAASVPVLSFEEQIADAVFRYTNSIRQENGVPLLQRNKDIDAIALPHAEYLASVNNANHDNVDQRWDQLDVLGFNSLAENCVPVRSGSSYDYCDHDMHTIADTPDAIGEYAVDTLINHDWCEPMNNGHRTNILNPLYTDIGIGVAKGELYYYVTQDFGG